MRFSSLQEFNGNAAHEFRTPFGNDAGAAGIIRGNGAPRHGRRNGGAACHAEGADGAAFKTGENASGNERNEHD